jgi:hypothetical protein
MVRPARLQVQEVTHEGARWLFRREANMDEIGNKRLLAFA